MGNCLSRILKACFSPKGDSSAEAGIDIRSNSDSHNLTDQIRNTGNSLSSIHDAQSSPEGGDSSAEAGIDSHNLTDQIHNTGNSLSGIHDAQSSPEGGDSSSEAGINIGGYGGDNSNSHSFTNQISETGNILSSTDNAYSLSEGNGDSGAEGGINIGSDGGGNSDPHNLTDQINNTGKAHCSPLGVDSSAGADNIRGDYRGNSGSGNQFNSNNIYNYGRSSFDEEANILRCLYKTSYESHRDRVRDPVKGTCTWVTEHRKYKDWSEKRGSGLLWLSADPGYGKSVTASFLITHLKTRTDAIVCYFFFKDDSDEQRNPTFALCALLHQLFKQRNSLCRYAKQELKSKGEKFTEHASTLWNILVKAVAEGGCGRVICVVDALDECEERGLPLLIHHITHLSGSQNSNIPLKFLVTSRPYHRIAVELRPSAATIRLKGENEIKAITADVTRVINEGVENLESVWECPGGLEYLRELLRSKADRTFLWVSLILELLRDSADGSRAELIKIVSTAPASLDELYIKILSKSRDYDKARRILSIVAAAARPLTLMEMNIALTIRRDHKAMRDLQGDLYPRFENTVKDLCGLFVRVIDSNIYLVHQTAREFLYKGSSPSQENWQFTLNPEHSNFIMADICFSYLSLREFETDPLVLDISNRYRKQVLNDYLKKYAFLEYAAEHWADHFRDSQDQRMELFEFTQHICEAGSERFLTWLQVSWPKTQIPYQCPKDLTHLMIASQLGQGTVVEQLLEEGGDIDTRSEDYGTALDIAAARKDKDITRMLIQKNAKGYLNSKEYNILNMKKSELESFRLFERIEREGREREEFAQRLLGEETGSLGEETEFQRRFQRRRRQRRELQTIEFLQDFCIADAPDPAGDIASSPSTNLAAD